MSSGALARLLSFTKLFKKPWEITGLASTPEYHEYLPTARDYRKFAPGSPPVSPIIPHDVPALVFNTRYYARDYRRNSKYEMHTVDRTPLDVDKLVASMPLRPEDITYVSAPGDGMVRARGV